MRIIVALLRAFVFFTLFAFALNNQHEVEVHWFFGSAWRAPLVMVVLAVFGAGCALGVLSMVPSWWRHRRMAQRSAPAPKPKPIAPVTVIPSEQTLEHPPREGL